MPQEEINRLLLEHARAGRRVVRLKGGDPFVFGRGGEEALVLREAGIHVEVVPGVTAGVAAPAYAGIPVTHRELASGVAFVTGHEDPDKPDIGDRLGRARRASPARWSSTWACARCRGSPSGWSPRAARRASPSRSSSAARCPASARSLATLADVAERAAAAAIRAPAITLVGPVAALREQLAWLERRPLHGRTRRGHARPRAGEPARRAAARARRGRSSRRRRSGSSRSRTRCRTRRDTTSSA